MGVSRFLVYFAFHLEDILLLCACSQHLMVLLMSEGLWGVCETLLWACCHYYGQFCKLQRGPTAGECAVELWTWGEQGCSEEIPRRRRWRFPVSGIPGTNVMPDLTGVHIWYHIYHQEHECKNLSCVLSVGVGVLLDEEKLIGNAFSCISWFWKWKDNRNCLRFMFFL